MGADMVTMVLPLPVHRQLDWHAAALAVRNVRLAALWGAGDLYPWEEWLEEVEYMPGAVPAFVALRAAQAELHGYACQLRWAVECGWTDELLVLDTPAHRVWVAGGPSWGEPAGELIDPAILLAEAGITTAAGFDGYTRYIDTAIEQRTLEFADEDVRSVLFGVTVAHASGQAAGMGHPASGAGGRAWLDAWLTELDGIQDAARDEIGRAVLRFAARGLAICAWLTEPATPLSAERLDEGARHLAQIADEGALDMQPPWPSWSEALQEIRLGIDDLGDRFDVLDDPAQQEEDGVRAFIDNAGGTLGDAIEIEVSADALFTALVALVDLCGDDVTDLLGVPPAPIVPEAASEPEMPAESLDQYLSLVLVGAVDWVAGDQAIDAMPNTARPERHADLSEFKQLLTANEYRRFATSQEIGTERLHICAPHGAAPPDVATSIGRLGHDGILDAIGVTTWSAPDPDSRGR